MKKWFDKMNKGKKGLVGAGVAVALVLLLTLGAWGVYAVTAKPQDTVAKNDAVDARETGQKESETKKDDKKSSNQKSQDKAETDKDEEEKGEDKDVAGSDAKEPTETVENTNAMPKETGNITSSNPVNNTTSQGNKNSNQTVPSQTQPQNNTVPKQNNQQSSQTQNQQPSQQQNQQPSQQQNQQNPAPAEQPKQEEKPVEQPKPEEKQPVWHDPVYERRWIVEQAAWDETVSTPIYEEHELSICNQCGADITNNIDAHFKANWDCSGYHSDWKTVQVGTDTSTLHHEEVGHWEDVLVKDGYWE